MVLGSRWKGVVVVVVVVVVVPENGKQFVSW